MGRAKIDVETLRAQLQARPSLLLLPSDLLLTMEEAAAYLSVAPSTLEKFLSGERSIIGGPPPFLRLHDGPRSPIRFMVGDLRQWVEGQRITPCCCSRPEHHQTGGAETPAQVA